MAKKKIKSDFVSLLMNEDFVRLVQSSENPDAVAEQLNLGYGENARSVRYAIKFIQMNQGKAEEMSIGNFNRILEIIQQNIDTPQAHRTKIIPNWIRVSAMLFILIASGGFVAYQQLSKDRLAEFARREITVDGKGLIILSDGSRQILNDDSFIDYNSVQGEVIIKKDEQEKIIGNNHEKEATLNQILVPYGQRHKVLLSDGTLVQLNAGSKLSFPATFSIHIREVYLEGEGFFEVHKNVKVPFIVKTDYFDIKVLGTKFNVSAYADEQVVSAVLVEGKVNVSEKNKMFGNEKMELSPGQGCFYSIADQRAAVKRNVDVNDYIAWKDGMYIFKSTPLRDVVKRIIKYYNQPIRIEGDELASTTFSGKLMLTDDVEEVLLNLAKTLEGNLKKTNEGYNLIKNN